jgi:hypothetical protein
VLEGNDIRFTVLQETAGAQVVAMTKLLGTILIYMLTGVHVDPLFANNFKWHSIIWALLKDF